MFAWRERQSTVLITIEGLNSLDREDFVDALGWVFENSPWVAENAWSGRPYATAEQLHGAMVAEVEAASWEQQLALLRAHPDLGTRMKVSAASAAEQGGAGLDRLTPQEFEELQRLNKAYRAKFGFPFLFAVKGSSKQDILRAFRQRLESTKEQERAEALRQVYRIAQFRIEESVTK
jgi:2-oxo-4-hydroxy-4-carboxy-5-ureidoimidazoline decarboxylase